MATTTEFIVQGTATTLLSTELNSLGASSYALSSSAFDNEQGTANFNGYTDALIDIHLAAPSGAFAANSAIYLWWIKSLDGTTFEDSESSGSLVSAQLPDYQWIVAATANAQEIVRRIRIPPSNWKVMIGNIQGSGTQAWAASGNTIKVKPFTTQGV